ncbi:hypothetical protein ACFLXJ_06175 [Chloroflexota bacterium]
MVALMALVEVLVMFDSALSSFSLFAAGMFAMLNGPLWLSVRARAFAGSRQAPIWLYQGVSWFSRLLGLAMLVTWVWFSTGALKPALLLGIAVGISLFCLLDGPWRIIKSVGILKRGREVPVWTGNAALWFIRLVGMVGLLGALVTGVWATVA